MATSEGAAPSASSRTYKLVAANYRDTNYPDGVLVLNLDESEMELRQLTGKKKNEETLVARFRMEYNAQVVAEGPLLKVSELSITLESPAVAQEVAGLIRQPIQLRANLKVLADVESSVGGFLGGREEALSLISQMRTDPRAALVGAESMWTAEYASPVDAVYSAYSKRLAESLEKTKASISSAEASLGPVVTGRLYALAYTIGAVQDALFEERSGLDAEVKGLEELGVATTAGDLRVEKPTQRLMARAHETLVVLVRAQTRFPVGA